MTDILGWLGLTVVRGEGAVPYNCRLDNLSVISIDVLVFLSQPVVGER